MDPKTLLLHLFGSLGITRAVGDSRWRTARVLVLCYHGVSLRDEHVADPALYVSRTFLRDRFSRLAAGGYAVLGLAAALARLEAGTLPPRSVVLTFDDGTRDFAEVVVPLLEEYRFPATVYVTTYYCDHPLPVFDTALRYLIWRLRASRTDLRGIAGCDLPLPVTTEADRATAWRHIHDAVTAQAYPAEARQRVLRDVAARGTLDFEDFLTSGMYQQMTPAQIRALPEGLVDVQLHTHRHRTPRDRALFVREIEENRHSLSSYSAALSPEHFCYPSGDYQAAFIGWLEELGVKSATTCVPGFVERGTHRLLLPRFLDTSLTPAIAFESWISGVAALLPRRAVHRFDASRLPAVSTPAS